MYIMFMLFKASMRIYIRISAYLYIFIYAYISSYILNLVYVINVHLFPVLTNRINGRYAELPKRRYVL